MKVSCPLEFLLQASSHIIANKDSFSPKWYYKQGNIKLICVSIHCSFRDAHLLLDFLLGLYLFLYQPYLLKWWCRIFALPAQQFQPPLQHTDPNNRIKSITGVFIEVKRNATEWASQPRMTNSAFSSKFKHQQTLGRAFRTLWGIFHSFNRSDRISEFSTLHSEDETS